MKLKKQRVKKDRNRHQASQPQTMDMAIQHLHAARLDHAENILRNITRGNPRHGDAINLLGIIAQQKGELGEAEALFRMAISLDPSNGGLYINRGNILKEQGKLDEAVSSFQKALKLMPQIPEVYNSLGNAYYAQGRLDEAATSYRAVLKSKPDYAEARYNLGNVYHAQGLFHEAVEEYRKALQFKPNYPDALYNLGKSLYALNRLDEAVTCYHEALALRSDFPEAYYNLGNVYHGLTRLDDAIACYREAIRLRATYAEPYCNLGNVLHDLGRTEEAIACYRQALSCRSDYHEALYNLGYALYDQGNLADAVINLSEALRLNRKSLTYRAALTRCRQKLCDWRENDSLRSKLIGPALLWDNQSVPPDPFMFLSLPVRISPAEHLEIAKNFGRWLQAGRQPAFFFNKDNNKNRLRIGYVSADFRNHAVAQLMQGLFSRHDRSRFMVYAFSLGKDDGSSYRRKIQEDCDFFIDMHHLSAWDAAQCIAKNEIDIAIDLNGYTRNSRPQIFAYRPAPIQVAWLGYPNTMGVDFIDYIITDHVVTPPDQQPFFTEQFLYLPNSYLITDCEQKISSETITRNTACLPKDSFIYCCFNNLYKIDSTIFKVWMDILRDTENSILWLANGPPSALENLRNEARKYDIDPGRLLFAPRIPEKDRHLARLRLADIYLDTFFYNGHTSGCDALWAGLPVISCPGETFPSRVGASLLHSIGLPQLIATDLERYKEFAVRLAKHPEELAALKTALAEYRLKKPFFDTDLFTRNLENALWQVWQKRSKGEDRVVG